MTFSEALDILKSGGLVTRTAWHGDICLFLDKGGADELSEDHPAAATYIDRKALRAPHIGMRTLNGGLAHWHAQHQDLLADDWAQVQT